MKKKILYWLPRILSIAFIAFISVFALDAFDQPQWPVALFMHLIPSFVLAILVTIAWKKPRLGGSIFIIAGLLALVLTRFEMLIVAVPMIVLGVLFLL